MKKSISILVVILTVTCALASPFFILETANATGVELAIDAKAAILVDAATGTVIYEKNADEKYDVAGVTKLAAALVIAEAVKSGKITMEQDVAVTDEAYRAGGMSAFLARNDSYAVETLYKAVLMISANDATLTLASAVSGSQQAFVDEMTSAAKRLLASPIFVNATGHKADGQQMSARDAALIAAELVKHESVTKHASVYREMLKHSDGRETELVNPNRLVRFYAGCDGLMTGSNSTAGYSGAFTAKRGTDRYIAVVIGARNSDARSDAAQTMLDYAFANYENAVVIEKGKGVAKDVEVKGGRQKTVHGVAGETLSLLLKKGESSAVTKEVVLFDTPEAPVNLGDTLGELVVKMNGQVVAKVPVVAHQTVEKSSVASALRAMLLDWLRR